MAPSSLIYLERPAAASPRACWSSTTAAAPTSATCSASPTCSTRSGGCTWSRRGRRCRSPGSPGYHWYLVPRVGYPDPETFHAARAALAELHDRLWEETGIGPARTVLGGFSMGAVMSYAMALGADRPAVAGILAFSGFVPIVEGWQPSLRGSQRDPGLHRPRRPRPDHRRSASPTAPASCSRPAGSRSTYRESDVGHQIDPAHLADATELAGRDAGLPAPQDAGPAAESTGARRGRGRSVARCVSRVVEVALAVARGGGDAGSATVKLLAAQHLRPSAPRSGSRSERRRPMRPKCCLVDAER